jgi:dihydrofolate reductase
MTTRPHDIVVFGATSVVGQILVRYLYDEFGVARDLDWAAGDSYVPEFSEALTKLAKGEMTQTPVKTQFGWHIIKVTDARG